MWGRTSNAHLFLTHYLGRGLARVSARGASIARVKSKGGEAKFPSRKTVQLQNEAFRSEDGKFSEHTSTVNNYLFFIDRIVFLLFSRGIFGV